MTRPHSSEAGEEPGLPSEVDAEVVARQIGRPPRGMWTVASRCSLEHPQVIAVAPALEDGTPFPTAFWLTCPHLVERIGALESAGAGESWERRLAADTALAQEALEADRSYRAARSELADGIDPCRDTGVAGQADALRVKCLHARVAAALSGVADPIGIDIIEKIRVGPGIRCAADRCCPDVGDTRRTGPRSADIGLA